MPQWLTLDPQHHLHAGWQPYKDYRFAASEHLCLVQMAELTHAFPWYPLVFVQGEGDMYHLMALLGLTPGSNLYLNPKGQWTVPYVPAYFRSYPFRLNPEGNVQIDSDAGLFADPAGAGHRRLYDDQGQPSEPFQQIQTFLQKRLQGLQLTQRLVDQLKKHELFEVWPITWTAGNKKQGLKGVYRTNEERLRALPPEAFGELAHSGGLGLAYGQIFSQARLDTLIRLQQQAHQDESLQSPDLEKLFGGKPEDLSFNFSDF